MTAQDKALKENTASAPLQIVAPGTCVETGEQATLVLGMYDHLVETIHQYNPSADFAQIDKAFRYADTHHNGQLRKDGSPFITHPLAVAQIIAEELRLDSESIEAALMHDCIEDTSATYAEIAKEFSPAVADLVEGVSKLTRVQYASKEEEQMENLRKMLMAMAKDIRVILIKLADRTHNMRTMEYQTAEKQRQKSLETMEIYAPIAHRLGMQRIKWELEDLSLKYLDPVGYDEITRSLAAKEAEHEAFMERVQAQIEERLKEQHVPYLKVYGRMKHPYSIYRKMYAQNKTMDEVLDLFAFRVIVDTVADCYNVLGTDIEAALLKKTSFGSMDEMYAAIGYGGFSAQKAVNRIHDEIVKLEKQRKEERAATVPVDNSGATRPAVPKRTKSEQGIVVEGLSNCLVKFSKCCTPVPGDEIVGFITRGYGVSVHRCDCPNAAIERRKPEERGRWIKVSWGTDVKESYQTALDIYAKDRLDLVLDVSAALSSSQTRVASINATTTADGFAVIHLSIFISDAQHLAAVMRRLHQISGVMKVDRPAG